MVRHIVMWNYKEGLAPEEKRIQAERMKASMQELKNCIPGVVELELCIDALPSSNRDIVLNSLFESVEALAAYQVHPKHVSASKAVGDFLHNRTCIDYME